MTPEASIRAALEAKPQGGDWYVDQDPRHGMSWNRQINAGPALTVCFMAHSDGKHPARDAATADFIAACSPTNITALLAELDTLRAEKQERALQYLSDQGQWIEETGKLISERDAALARAEAAEADAKAMRGFADLWYFVMDEKPMEFERIVSEYSPARWMDEALKLRAASRTPASEKGNDHV